MLITIDHVLSAPEVKEFRARLAAATWQDGLATAGSLAQAVKRNEQLPDGADPAQSLGQCVLERLSANPTFVSAALPHRIYPPKFNRYRDGGSYGTHVDSALMVVPGTQERMRCDLSATLFLSAADDYEGGELEIEGPFGAQAVKLEAGDLVLYPSSSLHRVTPVTGGVRLASFFWIQSLVADAEARTLLFDLDQSIRSLRRTNPPEDPQLLRLSGIYHNLLRRWAQT